MSFFSTLRERWSRKTNESSRRATAAPPVSSPVPEAPPFTLEIAERMRFDPQIRIGIGARNGLLSGADVEIHSPSERVAEFVREQWNRVWNRSASLLLRTKLYGFLPVETEFRRMTGGSFRGAIGFERFREYSPRETRILTQRGGVAGFRRYLSSDRFEDHLSPRAVVFTFDAEGDNLYGRSLLERAYAAWFEKWREGGAKQLLRVRMMKDAFVGDVFWYPPDRTFQLPSGRELSWSEVAREMVEARSGGGAMILPMIYDSNGRKLIDYTPPRDVSGAAHVFTWKSDLDLELWKALEVPPEILEAARVGSGWSGRSVPLLVAIGAVHGEFVQLAETIDRCVLRRLVELEFGSRGEYELRCVPASRMFAAVASGTEQSPFSGDSFREAKS